MDFISDPLEYTNKNNISGLLFSADFQEAFDSAEYSFIFLSVNLLVLVNSLFIGLEIF